MIAILLAMFGGTARSILCVTWARTVQRNDAILLAMVLDGLDAAALRIGLGEGLTGTGPGIAWVVGAIFGTWITLTIAKRQTKRDVV